MGTPGLTRFDHCLSYTTGHIIFLEIPVTLQTPITNCSCRYEASVTSIIKIMMELNRCTTRRALAVTANYHCDSRLRELAKSFSLNPNHSAGSSTKIHLMYGSKTKTFSLIALWLFFPHLSSMSGSSWRKILLRVGGCGPNGLTGEITTNTQCCEAGQKP